MVSVTWTVIVLKILYEHEWYIGLDINMVVAILLLIGRITARQSRVESWFLCLGLSSRLAK